MIQHLGTEKWGWMEDAYPGRDVRGGRTGEETRMNRAYLRVQKLIRELHSCSPSLLYPHVHLEYTRYRRMACIWEESLPTQIAARWEAEQTMEQLYRQAVQKYGRYTDPRSPDGFLTRFQEELNQRLSSLREALVPCRTERTAAVCNRISIDLKPDGVLSAMEQANLELLTRYALPEPEVYFRCIRYEKDDPSRFEEGLLKLAAKAFVRYGYDLLPAINQMEQDAMDRLRGFERELETCASRTIHQYLIAPIQAKLPILRELLEGTRKGVT